jgi:hypothetical protein
MSAKQRAAGAPAANRNRLASLAQIAVFDIAGPLVAYSLVRSAGASAVTSLLLSGAFPAFGVALTGAPTSSESSCCPGSWWERSSGW